MQLVRSPGSHFCPSLGLPRRCSSRSGCRRVREHLRQEWRLRTGLVPGESNAFP